MAVDGHAVGRAEDSERAKHFKVSWEDGVATLSVGDQAVRLDRDALIEARKLLDRAFMEVG